MELGLGGVETPEAVGEFALEVLQIGVHIGRITLHGIADLRLVPCCCP